MGGLGLIAYDAIETEAIKGKRSEDAAKALGYDKISPLIHRDNLIWHRS